MKVSKKLFNDKILNYRQVLLGAYILDICSKKGICTYWNNYFAKVMGVSDKTISRDLKTLEDQKYIQMNNIYTDNALFPDKREIYAYYTSVLGDASVYILDTLYIYTIRYQDNSVQLKEILNTYNKLFQKWNITINKNTFTHLILNILNEWYAIKESKIAKLYKEHDYKNWNYIENLRWFIKAHIEFLDEWGIRYNGITNEGVLSTTIVIWDEFINNCNLHYGLYIYADSAEYNKIKSRFERGCI